MSNLSLTYCYLVSNHIVGIVEEKLQLCSFILGSLLRLGWKTGKVRVEYDRIFSENCFGQI